MTVFLADIASYQGGLKLADVKRAGFGAVNFKVSHGLGVKAVHPNLKALVVEARALGLHRASFHYLTAEASGTAQADHAYAQLVAAGLTWGVPHFVDCEADATLPILTDYIARMAQHLGRKPGLYSGDWWWQVRGWAGAALSPHLMSAPNGGYVSAYPGDDSRAWIAGWGGWSQISVLQYEVGVLRFPDGTSGSIKVSKAAVRDLAVWADLAGGQMTAPVCTTDDLEQYAGPIMPDPWTDPRGWPSLNPGERSSDTFMAARAAARADAAARAAWILVASLVAMRNEFNRVFPDRDKSSDGSVGDLAHQQGTSGHNPDEEGHSETTDADDINEVRAIDIDADLRMPGVSMEDVIQYLVQQCRAGKITFIRYIIFNKRIWSKSSSWITRAYSGANPHDKHAHVSCEPDTASENTTKSLGLATLVEEDMPLDNTDKGWLKSAEFTNAVAAAVSKAVFGFKFAPDGAINPDRTFGQHVDDMQDFRDAFVHALTDPKVKNRPLAGSGFDVLVKAAQGNTAALANLQAFVSAAAAADQQRDSANTAALLAELNAIRSEATDPVTEDELETALARVAARAFSGGPEGA